MRNNSQVQVTEEENEHHGRAGIVRNIEGEGASAVVTVQLDASATQEGAEAVFEARELRVLLA